METIKELLAIGRHHFDRRQYAEAEDRLKRVLEQEGNYADVLNMLGVISHAGGRFSDAADYFKRALRINPRYAEATLNLAVLMSDLGRPSDAKKLYLSIRGRPGVTVAKVEPVLRGKLSNLHADVGDIYRSIGLNAHAAEEYRKALKLNPSYADIRVKLGQALREAGAPRDALRELALVIRDKPRFGPALLQMGITAFSMGRATEAKRWWRRALALSPQDEYARMYLRLCDALGASAPGRKAAAKKNRRRINSLRLDRHQEAPCRSTGRISSPRSG